MVDLINKISNKKTFQIKIQKRKKNQKKIVSEDSE